MRIRVAQQVSKRFRITPSTRGEGRVSIRWPIFLVREFLLRELEEVCGQGFYSSLTRMN